MTRLERVRIAKEDWRCKLLNTEVDMDIEYGGQEVVDEAWRKYWMNDTWSRMVDDRQLQRVILWKIENQRLEEKLLESALLKMERRERVRIAKENWRYKLLNTEVDMDIEYGRKEVVDWMETDEAEEHEVITIMMRELGIVLDRGEDMELEGDLQLDEEMEHAY